MKKAFNFKKEISMSENVSSITSISLETSFNEGSNCVEGVFLVEGNYKTHELSLNKKEFKYELPFKETIENLKEGSLDVEVEDFTYDVEDNTLTVDIDYEVNYEENEIPDEFNEEEFERFLSDHEVDIVNMNEENEVKLVEERPIELEESTLSETEEIEEETCEVEETMNEEINLCENDERDVNLVATPDEDNGASATNAILNSIDKEEKYITYHVYICESDDTFESISEKFKTTKEEIREYNDIDDIEYGRKIIIPVKDE